jgi:acyl dehydratase
MKTLGEYVVGARERFGAHRVTREEVIDFASRFDPQPFHLDDAAGAANPIFGRLSASGWHTAAMTMRMIVDHARANGGFSLGSPGMDELRWPKPAYPDDVLSVETEILEARQSHSRPEIGLIKTRILTRNQNDEIVLIMVSTILVPVTAG